MLLSKADGELFFEIWFQLLGFAKREFKMKLTEAQLTVNTPEYQRALSGIADKVWDHPDLLDKFLFRTKLTAEKREILLGWKRFVKDTFFVRSHLKSGTILISLTDQKVYSVHGITSTWEEMIPSATLPMLIETTLIPFKGIIVSDGLIKQYDQSVGISFENKFEPLYIQAKESNSIITSI